MTDNDDTTTDEEQTASDPAEHETDTDEPFADQPNDTDSSAGQKVVRSLQWAAFAILILVALVATFRFYFAASNAINEFVTHRYRPLFQAIFNLVILLASALGLSVLVRRIA